MNPPPVLSVIVPSLNRAEFLRSTIDSILGQDYPHIECLVMDGASSDGTVDILASYGDRIKWRSEPDKTQAHAIDAGLRMSRGDICTWLNADDIWWKPDTARAVISAFEEAKDADVIYGDCACIDVTGRHIGESYIFRNWSLRYAVESGDHGIPQPSAFIRRRALERVNYLNTSLIFMDRDLWLRIGLQGNIRYVPICFAAARFHKSHWHSKYRRAADEWIEISAGILDNPALPAGLGISRSKSMANSCLRAMQYAWIGRHFGESALIGLRALLYRPTALYAYVRDVAGLAEEANRPLLAYLLRQPLRATDWTRRALGRIFRS